MSLVLEHGWVVVAVPVVVALLVIVAGGRLGRALPALAALGPATVLAVGGIALLEDIPNASHAGSVEWMRSAVDGGLSVGWRLDALAAVMLLAVGVVSTLVVVFSSAYMHSEAGLPRYYGAITLFTGSMAGLVIADSLLGIFIAWEIMGACSYLLIGFWFTRREAARAAMKAFLVTRIGDVGLLVALALLWADLGTLSLNSVFAAAPGLPPELAGAVGLLVLMGAVGKSAQFPLHIWLPDAMEGPTPVSALIHAATMVAAGVFLIVRTWPLFSIAEVAMYAAVIIGGITAVGAALSALVQTDLKRVLAYSTVSQLGFMFCALGVGAWAAALFHLVTHAFFKALLFLGAGSLTHACGSRDLKDMGGLFKKMPLTGVTWMVGAGALAGIPPLAGFFSKDKILHEVATVSLVWAGALFAASFLTALYVSRTTRLALFGPYRGSATPHEGSTSMRVPLVVLASLAASAGVAGTWLVERLGAHASVLDAGVALSATVVAGTGVAIGWLAAGREREAMSRGAATVSRLRGIRQLAGAGWGVDSAAHAVVVTPTLLVSRALAEVVDRRVIDGLVHAAAASARGLGRACASLQSGDVQWYATMLAAGAVAMLALSSFLAGGV